LYFDNFFNSPALQIALVRRGISVLAPFDQTDCPTAKMIADSELEKQGHGALLKCAQYPAVSDPVV